MENEREILDMIILELAWHNGILTVIREDDHVLRRFGQVDVVKVSNGSALEIWRQKADEIWAVISGEVRFSLEDRREDSPSGGVNVELELSKDVPQAILVPFGVTCKVSSTGDAILLRIGTHQNHAHAEDQIPFL